MIKLGGNTISALKLGTMDVQAAYLGGVQVFGGAAFSPASLFASGEEGAWFEPSPTTCFTDTARTTPASVGQAVAGMTDLSGRGNHATQAITSARPILRQAGTGEFYLEFDGIDDFLVTTNLITKTDMDLLIAMNPGADTSYMMIQSSESTGGKFALLAETGDTSLSYAGGASPIGTPSMFVDGSAIGNTRNDLYLAATGGPHIVEAQNLNLSSFLQPSRFVGYGLGGAFMQGAIYGIIFCEDMTSQELIDSRTYLAAKSGVTL
jgi:hypothetical protein